MALVISFEKMKKMAIGHIKDAEIKLRLKSNAAGVVTDCFVDEDAIIQQSCLAAGGVWTGSTCQFPQYVKKAGDTMTGNLNAPKFIGDITGAVGAFSNSISSPSFCTGANCKSIHDLALSNKTCPNGQVQSGVKADGTPQCRALQCAPNLFFAGLDIANNSVCRPYPTKSCPTNEYVSEVYANGTVRCEILPNNALSVCPRGQVIQSIHAGVPTCVDKGAGTSCAVGQVVTAVASDGSVTCSRPLFNCAEGTSLVFRGGAWTCGCADDHAWDNTIHACRQLKEGKYTATRDYNGCWGYDFYVEISKEVSALKNRYIYNIKVVQIADYSYLTQTSRIFSGETATFHHANGRDSQSLAIVASRGIDDRVFIKSNNCKGGPVIDRYTITNADFN